MYGDRHGLRLLKSLKIILRPCRELSLFDGVLLTIATRKNERLARNPAGIVGCEEHRRACDFVGLRDARSERSFRLNHLAGIALAEADRVIPLRPDLARIDRVHADVLRTQLL